MSFHDAAHLLRRAGFGGTVDEIHALSRISRDDAVDAVCDMSAATDPPPPAVVYDESADWWVRYVAMFHWWLNAMASSPTPLREKLTLFWHGHLVSGLDKVGDHRLMLDQNRLLRAHGTGDFLGLVQAVALDPAMLVYLDNYTNRVGAPNENFARELLELFVVGPGKYTQADVVAAARAWTGHGVHWYNDDRAVTYEFHPWAHDGGAKTFLGTTRNWDGPTLLDHVVTGPLAEVSARFIMAKLWSFFAYTNPEPALVAELAEAYRAAGRNIAAAMAVIFRHAEFWSERARDGLVRSPTELVVATMRATGIGPDELHPEWYAGAMGQRLYDPPDVSGWRQNSYWISSAATWARAGFAHHVGWKTREAGLFADTRTLSPATAAQRALDTFGLTEASPATRGALEAWVKAERTAHGWAEPPFLVVLTMLSPDFQLA